MFPLKVVNPMILFLPIFPSATSTKTLSKKGKIEEKQLSKDLDILATYI